MSRPRQYTEPLLVPLLTDQQALVKYYAWKYGREQADVVRVMISTYAKVDKSFDVDEFQGFVKKEIMSKYKGDKEMQNEVKKRIDLLLEGRK